MTLQEMLHEIPILSIEERKTLINALVDSFLEAMPKKRERKLSEFAGIGEQLYDGTDAQEYVNQLRNEWDDPV